MNPEKLAEWKKAKQMRKKANRAQRQAAKYAGATAKHAGMTAKAVSSCAAAVRSGTGSGAGNADSSRGVRGGVRPKVGAVRFGFSPWTSIGGSAAHIVASLLSLRGRAARLCIALAGGIIAMPFANDVIGEVSAFLGAAATRPCAASDLGGTA